jgi:hypothetical protein
MTIEFNNIVLNRINEIVDRTETYLIAEGGYPIHYLSDIIVRPMRLIHFVHTDTLDHYFMEYLPLYFPNPNKPREDGYSAILSTYCLSSDPSRKLNELVINPDEVFTILAMLEDKSGLAMII